MPVPIALLLAGLWGADVAVFMVSALFFAGLSVYWMVRSVDASGVMLGIDERGIYFGQQPSQLVAWQDITSVLLHNDPSDDGGGPVVSAWFSPLGQRRQAGGAFLELELAGQALLRHAPSGILIHDPHGHTWRKATVQRVVEDGEHDRKP